MQRWLCPHLLDPGQEALLELVGVAAQHVAGRRLLLQHASADLDAPVAQVDRLHLQAQAASAST